MTQASEVPRDQTAPAAVDIGNRAEAIVFQLEDVIRIIKGLFDQAEPHWANTGKHTLLPSILRWRGGSWAPDVTAVGGRKRG
jgi:hypothetical protein